MFRKVRSRSDDTHIAFQNVQDLRGLVDAGFSEEFADRGEARIIFGVEGGAVRVSDIRGVHAHRAELVHLEDTTVFTQTWCVVEGRALVLEEDDRRDDKEQKEPERERRQS